LASASVVGSNLTEVDVLATAAVAMGPGAADWLNAYDGVEAMLVTATGEQLTTAGWHRLLA
jgi:thiamine biosynthesis lipoprotein